MGRRTIFPGNDVFDQLEIILDVIGTPNEEDVEQIPREKSKLFVRGLEKREGIGFESLFPDASQLGLDLMKKLLV